MDTTDPNYLNILAFEDVVTIRASSTELSLRWLPIKTTFVTKLAYHLMKTLKNIDRTSRQRLALLDLVDRCPCSCPKVEYIG